MSGGRQNLPVGHCFPKDPDGPHVRKLLLQTLVVFDRGGEPDTVVVRILGLLAEDQDNFLPYINRETAKHRIGSWSERGKRVKHEFVRDGLARIDIDEELVFRKEGGSAGLWSRLRSRHGDYKNHDTHRPAYTKRSLPFCSPRL